MGSLCRCRDGSSNDIVSVEIEEKVHATDTEAVEHKMIEIEDQTSQSNEDLKAARNEMNWGVQLQAIDSRATCLRKPSPSVKQRHNSAAM